MRVGLLGLPWLLPAPAHHLHGTQGGIFALGPWVDFGWVRTHPEEMEGSAGTVYSAPRPLALAAASRKPR